MPPLVALGAYEVVMLGGAAIGGYMTGRAVNNVYNSMHQSQADPPSDAPPAASNPSSPGNDSAAAGKGAKDELAGGAADCGTGNCKPDDDPNKKKSFNKKFTPQETQGLRDLFGQGPQGAQDLLGRLNAGESVSLPEGVTTQTLQDYSQVAQQQINLGQDLNGVQAMRLQAIGKIIGR